MKRRRLFLLLVLLLLVGGLLLVPKVRWPIYGWLRGEAFYQGMPTSYWRKECRDHYQPVGYDGGIDCCSYHTIPSWSDRLLGYWGVGTSSHTPPLINGDPFAIPVLVELLRTGDRQSQLVATYALSRTWDSLNSARSADEADAVLSVAIPALEETTRSEDQLVSMSALLTLGLVNPEAGKRAWNLHTEGNH